MIVQYLLNTNENVTVSILKKFLDLNKPTYRYRLYGVSIDNNAVMA